MKQMDTHSLTVNTTGPRRKTDYYEGMRYFWHPVARAADVQDKPVTAQLLDEQLVLVRLNGRVAAMKDLCIHRGARLSLGWVAGGDIVCPYHGWRYNAEGQCTLIPQLPDKPPPSKARAITYNCQERHGLIWVCLADTPRADIAPFPEYDDPEFHNTAWVVERWKSSAPRVVENFMDLAHLAFVHEGVLGYSTRPEIQEFEVRREGCDILYDYVLEQPDNYHVRGGRESGELMRIVTNRGVRMPATAWVKKHLPGGETYLFFLVAAPLSRKESLTFWVSLRNFAKDEPDERFYKLDQLIRDQDRVVVESQRPEELPADLTEELHLKGPDTPSLVYRRWLGELGIE